MLEVSQRYKARVLEAMYQTLLTSGYNPNTTFAAHLNYLRALESNRDSVSSNFDFPVMVNIPKGIVAGTIFLSVQSSLYFANIPFALRKLMGDGPRLNLLIHRDTRKDFFHWKQKVYEQMENDINLRFLYTEDPASSVTMVKALKNGEHVLSYVDSMPKGQEASVTDVDFLNCKLKAPNGLFKISEKLGFPILPVAALCLDEPTLSLGNYLWPSPRAGYPEPMTACYQFFQNSILVNPAQWSQWSFFYDQYERDSHVNFTGVKGGDDINFKSNETAYSFSFKQGCIQ